MSISSICGDSAWLGQIGNQYGLSGLGASAASAAKGLRPAGWGNVSGSAGGTLFHDILATLQQMLGTANPGGIAPSATQGAANSTAGATGGTGAPGSGTTGSSPSSRVQDLQSFLVALMQALHQAVAAGASGAAGTSGAAAAAGPGGTAGTNTLAAAAGSTAPGAANTDAYRDHDGHGRGRISTQLQSLLQEVDGSSASGGTDAASQSVSHLQSSFQNLVQALSPPASSAAASSPAAGAPSLQSFLQSLLQNLQAQGVGTRQSGLLVQATA